MTYGLIRDERELLTVRGRCAVAEVSVSSYYRWRRGGFKEKSEGELLKEILKIIEEFGGYGYRRVTKELARRGFPVNKKRVQALMQKNKLQRKQRRRFVRTTDSKHGLPVYPNLVKGMTVTKPDQVWVSDITYVRLVRGFVYLAVILDLCSRKVIGWALSSRLNAELAVAALRMALRSRKVTSELVHHSDRGVQYASEAYVKILKDHGIKISMSRKGNPYDNAWAESFMKTLKTEEVYLNEYEDEQDARRNIGRFIETIYNNKRLHSSLGYLPPDEFEAMKGRQEAA